MINMKGLMPHGQCYLWKTELVLLHVVSDIVISLCYLFIPVGILIILRQRKDFPMRGTVILFMLFIVFCGIVHFLEVISVWYPIYYVSGLLKVCTAFVSVVSCFIFLKNIKNIINLPSFRSLNSFLFNNLHNVIEKLPVVVIFSDKNGDINYSNEYVNELFGYESSELRGEKVEILIEPKIRTKHREYRYHYFKNETDKLMGGGRILQGKTKNNGFKDLEVGLRPIKFSNGSDGITLVAIMDVSEQEKIKSEMAKALKLVQVATYGMPSLLSYIDVKGFYRFVNNAYLQKWNISESDIVGKHYKDFLPSETIENIKEKMNLAMNGEDLNFKIKVHFPKLGARDLDAFYMPHFDEQGKVSGVVVLAHDITDLNHTLATLESTNRQLEEYAFLVSHELRAPARHVLSFSELMEKRMDELNVEDEKISKYVEIITRNSEKMQDMISGMLKISSINQVKPFLESVDLRKKLEKVHVNYSDQINLVIKTEEDTYIKADRQMLESIFSNLFENSIHYKLETDQKASIVIEIKNLKKSVILEYYDKGQGIEEKLIEKVLNPFIKGDDSKGLGLGMTIVSRSIEKLSGTIEILPSKEGVHFKISFLN